MEIVVDTSVWSHFLRRKSPPIKDPALEKFRRHLEQGQGIILLGPILQELLTGVSPLHQDRLNAYLEGFPLSILEREDFVQAATLSNRGRERGIAVGTVDGLIAAGCIRRGLPLLTLDRDFERIASFTEIILF